MDFRVVHGPQRVPISLSADRLDPESAVVPFHGIVSRGLLEIVDRLDDGAQQWVNVAPFLDRVLAGQPVPAIPNLDCWAQAARDNGVLTFAESARCARRFVEHHGVATAERIVGKPAAAIAVKDCELWSIKEGHTSSVWIATLMLDGVPSRCRWVINVARDRAGGVELELIGSHLTRLHDRDGGSVVDVLGCARMDVDIRRDVRAVPVLAVQHLPEAIEIHALHHRGDDTGRCVLVERFLQRRSAPGRIHAIECRSSPSLSDAIWGGILHRLIMLSDLDVSGDVLHIPATEINEGDWVWYRDDARLVASSGYEQLLPLGPAMHFLALLHAGEGGRRRRVYWGKPEQALRSILHAARRNPRIAPRVAAWIDAARATSMNELRRLGIVSDPDSEQLATRLAAELEGSEGKRALAS